MRYNEFAKVLAESVAQIPVSRDQVKAALVKAGYENQKDNGNKIAIVTQIPSGQNKTTFRDAILRELEVVLKKLLPKAEAEYSKTVSGSSIGGIKFNDGSPVTIIVKDEGVQGDKSAGMGNEAEIISYLQSMIDKYKMVNIVFVDERGKKLRLKNVDSILASGKDVKNRKKADFVLHSKNNSLPVSIKELSAETWESADTFFGEKARQIIDKLVKQKVVSLIPQDDGKSYYLSKEIIVEPTEEEAISAIFGSDISPDGGIVIQDFEPKHYKQVDNNIEIECHAVITKKSDIPTSHMMVWLLRNNKGRLSSKLGIRGIRPMASVLNRAIGRTGSRDVILVDKDGNVLKDNPNQAAVDAAKEKQAARDAMKAAPAPEVGSEFATRAKR